jgi:hypothetical protein
VGLGLAIVREIARAHGGDVHLDTSTARGARFVVRMPLIDRQERDAVPVEDAGLLFTAGWGLGSLRARERIAERRGA